MIVYNEELLLPFAINFYKRRFPDCKIIIYDNGSTDKTVEIAKSHKCEVLIFDTNNEIDDEKLIELKNNCWKSANTDWVVVCDCDEMLDISEQQLIHEDKIGSTIISVEAYNMVNFYGGTNVVGIKHGCREVTYDKRVLFNKRKISNINYFEGAHRCNPIGDIKYSNTKYKFYHYRYIDVDYIIERYHEYRQRLSEKNIKNGWGGQYMDSEQCIREKFEQAKSNSVKIIND
jgi:glycosyltransferase involved in cell wall biosynthesis